MSHHGFRILHTSDWHLGNSLHEHSRLDEYKFFLDWLKSAIVDNEVDALLVSGDVFDTGSPSNAAQELYYSFLTSLYGTCCKNVVVTAGNHDSPATLNVSRSVLELLHVHVVATPDAESDFSNEILLLPSAENPELIVCAVPFLRDRALQKSLGNSESVTGETFVRNGTRAHFEILKERIRKLREEMGKNLPVAAMAHLFAAGSKLSENANETEFAIVGNLENVHSDIFSSIFDYVALGHIHRQQKVGGESRIRYSGSPLPMGFDEAVNENVVLLVDFENGSAPVVRPLGVPRKRKWVTISGDSLEKIRQEIVTLGQKSPGAWVRVRFTGAGSVGNIRLLLAEDFEKAGLELVYAEYVARTDNSQSGIREEKDLSELSPEQVFETRLATEESLEKDPELKTRVFSAFEEILNQIQNNQGNV